MKNALKTVTRITCVLLLVGFIAGASCQQNVLTPDKMSPKQRATFAMDLYSNAWDNYQAQYAATPKPITGTTQEFFQSYKKMMEVARPVVTSYRDIVEIGGTPSATQEQEIITLIYQLQAMLMKGTVK